MTGRRLAVAGILSAVLFTALAPWRAHAAASVSHEFDEIPTFARPLTGHDRLLAASVVVLDMDSGMEIAVKNPTTRRAPASTTKIMTALLILESGRLGQTVTIRKRAATVPGTVLGLKQGQRVTLQDLTWAIVLGSANDAAVAAAQHLAGTEARFVAKMNAWAQALGMTNTHFTNPHGIDHPRHVSTAHDLAILARVALRNPTFARMAQTREAVLTISTGRNGPRIRRVLHSTNRLLGQVFGVDGVKTGTTDRAGPCLIASATRDGHQIIAVLLDDPDRWADAEALLEYGFAWRRRTFGRQVVGWYGPQREAN